MLSKVRLEEIFEPEEYIRGRKLEEKSQRSGLKEGALQANEKQEAKARHGGQEGEATERSEWEVETPQRVAPQGRTPGPPREGVPPGQAGRDLKPAEEDKPIPGAGKGTVIPPGREKEAITPSGQDKEGFTPPGREKGTFVPPGQDKELFIPPGRDKKTFVPPGRSKEGFVSPGLLNSSSTYSGWMKDKKIAPRLDNLKDRLILSESKGKGAEKNNSTKNNSTGKEKSKDSSRKGPSRRKIKPERWMINKQISKEREMIVYVKKAGVFILIAVFVLSIAGSAFAAPPGWKMVLKIHSRQLKN